MRLCSNFHMPADLCQFGNILEIWGDPDAVQASLADLTYEERLCCAHGWPLRSTGFCYTHQRQCAYNAGCHVRVQGPPCPDYSAAGLRRGASGPTFPTMLAAGAKSRLTRSALVVLENVCGLPEEVVADAFGPDYTLSSFAQSPSDVGFDCVARPRTGSLIQDECCSDSLVPQPLLEESMR